VLAEEAGLTLTGHDAAGGDGGGECSDAMFSQLFTMQQQVEDLWNEISANFIESCCFIQQVNANVKRIAVPAARQRRVDDVQHNKEGGNIRQGQMLSKRPRDLYVLWREFDVGIYRGKAAKDFTSRERGMNWYAYS
jgi:hypothetical protein